MKPVLAVATLCVAGLLLIACGHRSDDAYWRRATPEISKHLPR